MTVNDESGLKEIVSRWGSQVTRSLKNSASRFQHGKSMVIRKISDVKGVGGGQPAEKRLVASISYKVRSLYGMPQSVSFSFARHGVFVQKGVGRGYKMSAGMVIRTAKGKATNKREPNDWLNSVIDRNLPGLEEKLAGRLADEVVNLDFGNAKIK